MSALTGDRVLELMVAHFTGDELRFKAVCNQIARMSEAGQALTFAKKVRETMAMKPPMVLGGRPAPPEDEDLLARTIPTTGLAALALAPELRAALKELLEEEKRAESLKAAGFEPTKKLLLVGPPGTGKTSTAAALAHELRAPLITVKLAEMVSSYLGGTGKNVRAALETYRQERVVLFLDEIDSIGRRRSNESGNWAGQEKSLVVNTLLQELDGSAEAQGLLIAATNLRDTLDPALIRRFDVVLEYPMPDVVVAEQLARDSLARVPGASRVLWREVGAAALGHSHSDIVRIARSAGKAAVMDGRTLSTRDLLGAFRPAGGAEGAKVISLHGRDEADDE